VRLVLDTDVVVAAMRSPQGASAAIIKAARTRKAMILTSVSLALEYEAVCYRAELQLASGLTRHEVEIFVDAVIALSEPVETHFRWRPQLRDPDDEMVLEAAVNGYADALVTFNVRDFGMIPLRFGIPVLRPRDAIVRVKS
jgi:putative PIN family toxin of toxin-antitoxin system